MGLKTVATTRWKMWFFGLGRDIYHAGPWRVITWYVALGPFLWKIYDDQRGGDYYADMA